MSDVLPDSSKEIGELSPTIPASLPDPIPFADPEIGASVSLSMTPGEVKADVTPLDPVAELKVAIESAMQVFASVSAELVAIEQRRSEALQNTVAPEVREAIENINAQYNRQASDMTDALTKCKATLHELVKRYGQSYQHAGVSAIIRLGTAQWNDSALMGYSIDHPEILRFRTPPAPSVAVSLSRKKGS